jgi:2-oxoglutarate dehydrogenase complex dihydrolipoamide succinyltransferase (E2) component
MAETIKLPDLGEGIESADVVNVLVSPGDEVAKDQGIIEIETDKASVEVPAPRAGTIASIDVEEGQTLNVGDPIGTYDEGEAGDKKADEEPAKEEKEEKADEPEPEKPEAEEKEEKAEEPEPEKPESEEKDETPAAPEGRPGRPDELIPAGPSMRRMARDLGVDLRNVEGSGPGGRIEREDLLEYVRDRTSDSLEAEPKAKTDSKPAAKGQADTDQYGPVHREKLSKIRRTIAEKMAESFQTIPHVTHFDEADVTAMNEFRKEHKPSFEDKGVKLTLLPFVVRALASALREHPAVNARIDMDAGEIVYKDYVSIGIAVDTDRGLVVPVLRNVDQLSIAQIAEGVQKLAESTREGDFEVSDLRGGTFTVSNVGAIGGWYVTPIINKPESAILLVGRSKIKPVVYDGQITQRLIMPLSLSYDHRLIDGAMAARFMNEIINLLECPGRLLLTI